MVKVAQLSHCQRLPSKPQRLSLQEKVVLLLVQNKTSLLALLQLVHKQQVQLAHSLRRTVWFLKGVRVGAYCAETRPPGELRGRTLRAACPSRMLAGGSSQALCPLPSQGTGHLCSQLWTPRRGFYSSPSSCLDQTWAAASTSLEEPWVPTCPLEETGRQAVTAPDLGSGSPA